MYGLTEAFRSTYLPPEEIDRRPDSIGKAIPNAEILVLRADGTPCAPDEPGELVHRGALVALGYWNDPEKTAERFKPVPGQRSRARADRDRGVVRRHGARGRGRLPLLRRPPRRDDQDLRLSRQPDRGRRNRSTRPACRRAAARRRPASDARPGDRRRRGAAPMARNATRQRCSRHAASSCRSTWCRRDIELARAAAAQPERQVSTASCSPPNCKRLFQARDAARCSVTAAHAPHAVLRASSDDELVVGGFSRSRDSPRASGARRSTPTTARCMTRSASQSCAQCCRRDVHICTTR